MARVMAGMRTTGRLHIGHYFGALKNFLDLQQSHQCFFGAMDLHALTTQYKTSSAMPDFTREMIAEWLAWGLDPNKSVIFVQSQVPQHQELFFYFATITSIGWLERVPTWKEAEDEAKQSDTHNLGRFAYPVLQAADIAAYRGEMVPVGKDQVAHLELTREIVRRFNFLYSAQIPEPRPLLTPTPLVPGVDSRKMSKSYGNGLDLTEEADSAKQKLKLMPTDPARVRRSDVGNPERCNVFAYHQLFSQSEDLAWVRQGCTTAGIGCGDCKNRLWENFEKMIVGPREKKKELLSDSKRLDEIIEIGNAKARAEAEITLIELRDRMGLAKRTWT